MDMVDFSNFHEPMDQESKKRIAKIVREARGTRNQRKFALDLGVSQAAVQAWENAVSTPQIENLEGLARSLGISVDTFLALARGEQLDIKYEVRIAEDLLPALRSLSYQERIRFIHLAVDEVLKDSSDLP